MKEWKKEQWFLAYTFVVIAGTVFHFVYDWFCQIKIIGYFFPVNESTWEHMKLVYFPMLLYAGIFLETVNDKWLLGTFTGTWLIPVFFYTYRGVLGFGVAIIDISTFFLAVLGAFFIIYHTLIAHWNKMVSFLLKVLIIVQGILFVIFTYHPLSLEIFAEP